MGVKDSIIKATPSALMAASTLGASSSRLDTKTQATERHVYMFRPKTSFSADLESLKELCSLCIIPFYLLMIVYGLTQIYYPLGDNGYEQLDIVLRTSPVWYLVFFIQIYYPLGDNGYEQLDIVLRTSPVWYLVFFIQIIKYRRDKDLSFIGDMNAFTPELLKREKEHKKFITAGMIMCNFNDALFMTPPPEMFYFETTVNMMAHCLYLMALRRRYPRKQVYSWNVLPCVAVGYLFLALSVNSPYLAGYTLINGLLYGCMFFLSVANFETVVNVKNFMSMFGIALVVASNVLRFVDHNIFGAQGDSKKMSYIKGYFWIMIYLLYVAQFNIALSVG